MYQNRVVAADEAAEVERVEALVGRRSAPRLSVDLPAQLDIGGFARDVLVDDVSATGARLQLAAPPGPGTEVQLLWDGLVCSARVIWARADACGVAFRPPA
jgi:hypothetical protein